MDTKTKNFIKEKVKDNNHYSEVTPDILTKRWTILIGPNGSGKSMSLKGMKESLQKDDNNVVVFYSNNSEDAHKLVDNPFRGFDHDYLKALISSEGEGMVIQFWKWLGRVLPYRNFIRDKQSLYILLDELDSGLSLDNIYNIINGLKTIIDKANDIRDIYVVLSCNSYELLESISIIDGNNLDVLWVPSKEHLNITTYEEFKRLYIEFANERSSYEDL